MFLLISIYISNFSIKLPILNASLWIWFIIFIFLIDIVLIKVLQYIYLLLFNIQDNFEEHNITAFLKFSSRYRRNSVEKCLHISCFFKINNPSGRWYSARAGVSGNKRIEKSYEEGPSLAICARDALFAP